MTETGIAYKPVSELSIFQNDAYTKFLDEKFVPQKNRKI